MFSLIKKFLLKNKWLIFFVVGATSFSWCIKKGAIAWGVDSSFPLQIEHYAYQYFYFWTDKVAFSTPDASKFPMIAPFVLILLAIKSLGIHYSAIVFQKIIFFLLFSLSGFSAQRLYSASFHGKREIGGIIFGLFYMFNFYSLIAWHAQSWIIFFYAFFPIILSFIINALRNKKPLTSFLLISVVWSLLVSPAYVTPPFMILSWTLVGLLFLYHLLLDRKQAFYLISSFLVLFLSWLALNYYWLAPQFLFFQSEFVRRGVPGDQYSLLTYNSSSLVNVFRFLGPKFFTEKFLGADVYPWFYHYQTSFFILISFIPAAYIFYAVKMKALKQKMFLFWMLIFLFTTALLMGTKFPLGLQIYKALSFLKLAQIFRSIWQRFMPLYIISGGLLFAYALDLFTQNIAGSKIWLKRTILGVVIILVCVVFVFPFWTSNVYMDARGGQPSEKVVFPSYYSSASDWLNSQSGDGNIIPLPFLKMGLVPLTWDKGNDGYYGTYPLTLTTDRSYLITDVDLNFDQKLLVALKENDQDFFEMYNVEYLVFHQDINWNFIKSNAWYSEADQYKVEELVNKSEVFKQEADFGQITFFKNINYKRSKVSMHEADIRYTKLSPVQYSFEINNLKDKQTLRLSELQNTGWNIYLLNPTEPFKKNVLEQLQDFSHAGELKSNQLADISADGIVHNSWSVDPEIIKKIAGNNLYTTNADGSINLRGVLYFQPQTKLLQGFAISLASLLLILLVCLIKSRRKRNV